MIAIEALPADDGDCLWIEWTAPDGVHRMLVDGGRAATGLLGRLHRQPLDARSFDVVMCTHIDEDHIGGLLTLFGQPQPGFAAADVWFNAWRHIREDVLGPAQGEELSRLLDASGQGWNLAFGRAAVVVPDAGPLPEIRLPGLRVTLLSPSRERLRRLRAAWSKVITEAERSARRDRPADVLGRDDGTPLEHLVNARYQRDSSAANGSSIAVLLTHDDGSRGCSAPTRTPRSWSPG